MVSAAPYGTWPSPLGVDDVAAARVSRSGLLSAAGRLWWLESRPLEGGRSVVVAGRPNEAPAVVSPPGVSVRSKVYEYGGGAFCVTGGAGAAGSGGPETLVYVDQADQQVWRAGTRESGDPVRLTTEEHGEGWRYGDLRAAVRGWVTAVRERPGTGPPVVRQVVALEAGRPGRAAVLAGGRDFLAAASTDPDGGRLAWVCWDHPDMPWTASELWLGTLAWETGGGPRLVAAERLAGGRDPGGAEVSVGQPQWCEDGSLVFVSDVAGWWQPWRWSAGTGVRRLCDEEAEFHGPDWSLGQVTMAEERPGQLVCRRQRDGLDALCRLPRGGDRSVVVRQPCVAVSTVRAHGGGLAWLGATARAPATVWWLPEGGSPAPAFDAPAPLDEGDVAVAEHFTCTGAGGRAVHGHLYPPRLRGVSGPAGEPPPLVLHCHSGPTGSAGAGFDPVVQCFTTRGIAVATVDYGGSTGYGRAYRDALRAGWGLVDVDDCVAAARHLADAGRVDGTRMAIRGSSAGGFTALGALVRARVFAGAVSWYGVTDLLALSAVTHDFEAHYNDWLVGPLPAAAEEYRRRSPVHRVDDMAGAVLLLQGLDDPVVPPDQSAAMAEALRARGLRCDYLTFEGEGHGFRKSDTIRAALQAELAFHLEVLRLR